MDGREKQNWLKYVDAYATAYDSGCEFVGVDRIGTPTGTGIIDLPFACPEKPVALLCSPHPDDEILTGTLPFRLSRENGIRIVNAAFTLGSAKEHRTRRLHELEKACEVVGFDLVICGAEGFEGFSPLMVEETPDIWQDYFVELLDMLLEIKPDMIFMPHAHDGHPTHIASNLLAVQAAREYTLATKKTIACFETEFWQPMLKPNMLVGVSNNDLAILLGALNCHRGEVKRNPYHLRQPPRMMDNVRRGSEIIGRSRLGCDFLFGELYRLSVWRNGQIVNFDQSFCLAPASK